MRPDIIFKWLLLIVFVVLVTLAFLDYLFRSAPAFESFLGSYKGIIISLGTLLVILLATMLTTHLSNVSAEKRQEADRLLNAELKLSDFRQEWINRLRDDLAEIISVSDTFFVDEDEKGGAAKLDKLKNLAARVRMRLNPKPDAVRERKLEELLEKLTGELEASRKKDAIAAREALAHEAAFYLKLEWDVLKNILDELKLAKIQ